MEQNITVLDIDGIECNVFVGHDVTVHDLCEAYVQDEVCKFIDLYEFTGETLVRHGEIMNGYDHDGEYPDSIYWRDATDLRQRFHIPENVMRSVKGVLAEAVV